MKAWRKSGLGRHTKSLFQVKPFPSPLIFLMLRHAGIIPQL